MRKYIFILISLFFIVSGCSKQNEKVSVEKHSVKQVDSDVVEHKPQNEEEHHHDSKIHIMFHSNEEIVVNKEASLTTHILNKNIPLTDAFVRFEFWTDNDKIHDYIDATEMGDGVYKAAKIFSKSGVYHIKIHVENEKLHIHDHTETSLEVK